MNNKLIHRVSTIAAIIMTAGTVLMSAGCTGNTSGNGQGTVQTSSYATAKDILDTVWLNGAHDFPAFGGNFEDNVADAPGTLPVTDKDTMTNTLLIPEEVQTHVTDAATVFHMMNTNTFTSAALKLDGMSANEAAGKIKDSFKNNQFMCGIPEKIVIYSVGDTDLVYFYGAEEIIEGLEPAAAGLDGAKLVVNENY